MQKFVPILLGLAVGLAAATTVDARQRGSDISHDTGGNRGGSGHESKDSKTISNQTEGKALGKALGKAKKDTTQEEEPDWANEPMDPSFVTSEELPNT